MTCPKCGSANVNVQTVNDIELKNKHHGVIWWLFVGWWWIMIKWLIFFIPALIVKIFGSKKQKVVQKQRTVCVCQTCGYSWDIQSK